MKNLRYRWSDSADRCCFCKWWTDILRFANIDWASTNLLIAAYMWWCRWVAFWDHVWQWPTNYPYIDQWSAAAAYTRLCLWYPKKSTSWMATLPIYNLYLWSPGRVFSRSLYQNICHSICIWTGLSKNNFVGKFDLHLWAQICLNRRYTGCFRVNFLRERVALDSWKGFQLFLLILSLASKGISMWAQIGLPFGCGQGELFFPTNCSSARYLPGNTGLQIASSQWPIGLLWSVSGWFCQE